MQFCPGNRAVLRSVVLVRSRMRVCQGGKALGCHFSSLGPPGSGLTTMAALVVGIVKFLLPMILTLPPPLGIGIGSAADRGKT